MNNLLNEKNLFQNNFNKVSLKARFNLKLHFEELEKLREKQFKKFLIKDAYDNEQEYYNVLKYIENIKKSNKNRINVYIMNLKKNKSFKDLLKEEIDKSKIIYSQEKNFIDYIKNKKIKENFEKKIKDYKNKNINNKQIENIYYKSNKSNNLNNSENKLNISQNILFKNKRNNMITKFKSDNLNEEKINNSLNHINLKKYKDFDNNHTIFKYYNYNNNKSLKKKNNKVFISNNSETFLFNFIKNRHLKLSNKILNQVSTSKRYHNNNSLINNKYINFNEFDYEGIKNSHLEIRKKSSLL